MFCSIGLYICFYTSTTLFWLLELCNIIRSLGELCLLLGFFSSGLLWQFWVFLWFNVNFWVICQIHYCWATTETPWRVFIINRYWFLSKAFSVSTEMILWFLFFILLMWWITFIDLQLLKNPYNPGINHTNISIASLAFFGFPLAWNTFFHPFTFSLCMSLDLKWDSYKQHRYSSCFYIHSSTLCLVIVVFSLSTFKAIIDMYFPTALLFTLLGLFCRSFLLLLLSSFVLLWFGNYL